MMTGRLSALQFAPLQVGFSLAGLLLAFPSTAIEFSSDDGTVTGALDTTISYGTLWRVQGQDLKRYNGSSTPNHDDVNTNDGNRAYDTGLVSQVYRISADLEIDWEDQYGLFIRGTAFYDTMMMDRSNNWLRANRASLGSNYPDQTNTYPYGKDWSNDVLDGQGHDARIQDAYVYGAWDIGDMPLDIRFGRQVINWGEGLFYRDGINTVNALDGAAFALPGSEVKDLLTPQHTLAVSLGMTENLSMSAYYQFEWEPSVSPGRGSFLGTNDLFVDGGTKGYDELTETAKPLVAAYGEAVGIQSQGDYLVVADTSGKKDASDHGQWGVNLKYFAEELNDTELGFYFVRYNSHSPFIDAELDKDARQKAFAAVANAGLDPSTLVGQNLASMHILSNSIKASRVYPEGINMYGLSFNTAVAATSIAGELAYRPDMPMWVDHPDDLIADMKKNLPTVLGGGSCLTNISQAYEQMGVTKEYCLGGEPHKNYEEMKLWTGSLVLIHNFGPGYGFDGLYGILEPSFEYIQGLDDYDSYVSTASGPYDGVSFKDDYAPSSDRLDKFSWGYTAVLSGEWNDVFAGINLNPVLTFKHDVNGNSRLTGNFLAGRKAVTMALNGVYLNSIEAGLAYTTFFGSERTNRLHDRDNVAFNVKYSF